MPRAAWLQYIEKNDRWKLYCWQEKKIKEENKTKQKTDIIIITL